MELLGFSTFQQLQDARMQWVQAVLNATHQQREGAWSESLAVGSHAFVSGVQTVLGIGARHRAIAQDSETCRLREPAVAYCINFRREMRS